MIKAFKFGLLNPISGFDDSAMDVLYLRNSLWNSLVELEHGSREKYRVLVTNSDEELKGIQNRLDEIEAARTDLVARKKKSRSKARSTKVDTSELDADIDALLVERKGLRDRAKTLRAEVKERIKPQADELDKARYEAVKQLCKESGLWWAQYETVVASYDVARVKAMKENAKLRFRRFDGTGKYAVRQSGGFALEDLMAGKLTFARIESLPEAEFAHLSERSRRSRARHHLAMTIYTYKDENKRLRHHQVVWPIVLHRELPRGQVKQLHVQRKRVGDTFHWSCSITMEVDEAPKTLLDHPAKAACGIDLGFRLVKEGLRVATLADSSGKIRHFHLPTDWLKSMDYVEELQSRLSEQANLAWAKLRQVLSQVPTPPEAIAGRIANLLKSGDKTPIRGMRALHRELRDSPQLLPEALGALDEWSNSTYRRQREMHNLRDKLINRRKDLYRNVAIEIATAYALIRVEDMGLKQMVAVKHEDGEGNAMPAAVRDNRKRAALYELTLYIQQAAAKSGAEFEKVKSSYSTITCSACGHVNRNADLQDIHFSCENCGALHDQDENAAKNFLKGTEFYMDNQIVA